MKTIVYIDGLNLYYAALRGTDQRRISGDLRRHATWYKALNPAHLASAQLPDRIPGTHLSRPDAWSRL